MDMGMEVVVEKLNNNALIFKMNTLLSKLCVQDLWNLTLTAKVLGIIL